MIEKIIEGYHFAKENDRPDAPKGIPFREAPIGDFICYTIGAAMYDYFSPLTKLAQRKK
jgi:hypothetical protein